MYVLLYCVHKRVVVTCCHIHTQVFEEHDEEVQEALEAEQAPQGQGDRASELRPMHHKENTAGIPSDPEEGEEDDDDEVGVCVCVCVCVCIVCCLDGLQEMVVTKRVRCATCDCNCVCVCVCVCLSRLPPLARAEEQRKAITMRPNTGMSLCVCVYMCRR